MTEFWLISAPGEKTCQETWERLNRMTAVDNKLSTNSKFMIPDLKVGTLDQLVGLSDDLAKLDQFCEGISRKLVQYFAEVLEDKRDKLFENLIVNGKDMAQYLSKFQWEAAKYPVKQQLRTITDNISKEVTRIDSDLKVKATAYNQLKNNLAQLERKAGGSLLTKDLADVVKADDFILDSEYMITLLVVVPKSLVGEWHTKYEALTDMVVPRSSRLIFEDQENSLFTVTLFRKIVDDFKLRCREQKFTVREFVYDPETLMAGKNERDKLTAEKQRQFGPLVRWLKINFSEVFSACVHVKALRVFVESVLRYGLPVNFQAVLMQPTKGQTKRLRTVLNNMYAHLDSAGMSGNVKDESDEMPGLMALGMQEYYPYVFFKINIDLIDTKIA